MTESDDNKHLAENPVGDELLKDKMLNEIGEHLRGDYGCTRVWEAWQVGTMTQEDFYPLEEGVRVEELADLFMQFLKADRERYTAARLRKIAAKPHGGENKSQDYKDGYNEMRSKMLFEAKRYTKPKQETK